MEQSETTKEIIKDIKPNLEKAIEYLKGELTNLRAGRVSPSLVEDLEVECYDSKMKLKEVAMISSPDSRSLVVQPWDKNNIPLIEKAISQSSLGLSPVTEKEVIHLYFPPMSEERRKELIKVLGEKLEEARISIRHQREEVWKRVQSLEKEGKIREDDKFKGKEELQELIDEYNQKIEDLGKRKEEEIKI